MTDPAPTITVRGEAVLRASPDEAVLSITMSALQADPARAIEDVSRRTEALVALLHELGVPKRDRSTTGIRVGEQFEHTGSGRRSLGYQASMSMNARLTDRIAIGRLVTSATTDLQAEVHGPQWQIAAANPVRLEAARAATANAHQKARAYAEGIGAKLGRVMQLAEPCTRADAPHVRSSWTAAAAGSPGGMPIEPGEHEVSAAIDVTFALEQADGGR